MCQTGGSLRETYEWKYTWSDIYWTCADLCSSMKLCLYFWLCSSLIPITAAYPCNQTHPHRLQPLGCQLALGSEARHKVMCTKHSGLKITEERSGEERMGGEERKNEINKIYIFFQLLDFFYISQNTNNHLTIVIVMCAQLSAYNINVWLQFNQKFSLSLLFAPPPLFSITASLPVHHVNLLHHHVVEHNTPTHTNFSHIIWYDFYPPFLYTHPQTLSQSPGLDVDENGTLDLSLSKRLCSGGSGSSGARDSVLMPLEPMSPLRQATLLGSRCYGMGNAASCWDLPVDYSKIKHVDEDENEVKGGGREWHYCKVFPNQWDNMLCLSLRALTDQQ